MNKNKIKKYAVAAGSAALCICIIVASVIWVKRDKNTVPSGATQNKSTASDIEINVKQSEESTVESETSEAESSSQTQTTSKQENTTKKPENKPKPTEPKSTEPYTPNENYTLLSHEIAGSVPQKAAVSGSWFDDAVFVGDSVSLKLTMYESSVDRLGKAQFLTAGSLSATNALWDVSDRSVHPKYNGKKQKVEDSISQMSGVKKVYIMLGMNDINAVGINNGIKNFEKLCDNILKKSPNVQIYVQSVTPLVKGSKSSVSKEGKLNNNTIYEYNKRLAALAQSRGWYFVNVSEVMYDTEGCLKREYCGDIESMGLHFTNAGCKAWIDYLLTHTP